MDKLDEIFRIVSEDPNFPGGILTPDELSYPFGCLTSNGLQQMKRIGKKLRTHFAGCHHENTHIEVYSTCYKRTQLSAQGLLHGLLQESRSVPVKINPSKSALLNSFESRNKEMMDLITEVSNQPEFLKAENDWGHPLKESLLKYLPSDFAGDQQGKLPFRWMMAADFFWTQGLKSCKIEPPELEQLSQPTLRYLSWRFRQYYSHRKLLAVMIGPLFGDMIERLSIHAKLSKSKVDFTRDLLILSAHDVTIAAILYALKSHLTEEKSYWPPFGSIIFTLAISLLCN